MRLIQDAHPLSGEALAQQVGLLAAVEPTDAPFLSCYLDLGDGFAAARERLTRFAEAQRQNLRGAERLDFDSALDAVQAALGHHWPDAARGLALFARGLAGGRFLSVLPLDEVAEDRFTWYRVPDLVTLVDKAEQVDSYLLVRVHADAVRVLEVRPGRVSERGRLRTPGNDLEHAAAHGLVSAFSARSLLSRVVRAGVNLPLVIAGDPALIERAGAWLPRRLASRVLVRVGVSALASRDSTLASVATALAELRSATARLAAEQWVRALRNRGPALAGPRAVRDALAGGTAQTLVIAAGELADGWSCPVCGEQSHAGPAPAVCPNCRHERLTAWRADIELVRLARQQAVPVLFSDVPALRSLGGVGCLLQAHPERRAMTGLRRRPVIDLVA